MHRSPEHLMSFILAELGTEGSIDANQRFIMKGRYLPKQIESLLKKYIGTCACAPVGWCGSALRSWMVNHGNVWFGVQWST
jgi:translation initiation factor 2 beta subunit (eIF-2beta)/eIF-5